MSASTDKRIWDPPADDDIMENMGRKIMSAVFQPYWKKSVEICARKDKPPDRLKVAEVGCGTGTMALTFGLLGASVTLIDFNEDVLEQTRKIYGSYGCPARFINADCLENAPDDLCGTFDIVISVGLAEHFTGEARKQCFKYHAALLKKGGFVFIEVPNRSSPFYRFVRFFRTLTGTWTIDVEVPFSRYELKDIARDAGLKNAIVVGSGDLWTDAIWHWCRFLSAILDILPPYFRKFARKYKERKKEEPLPVPVISEKVKKRYNDIFNAVVPDAAMNNKATIADRYVSGIALFAFK